MADDLAALIEEKQRRSGQLTTGRSALDAPEETTSFEEFKRFGEALLKGSATGILDIVGGWGNLYDYFKKGENPSVLSTSGIINAISNAGGPDLRNIQGYKGAYTVGQAGAPAAALTAVGLPGLFGRTTAGVAGEFGVAGGTGLAAQTVAPDSPLSQFILQSSPYAVKGAISTGRGVYSRPTGEVPANASDLLSVGQMTPGELTGNRPQLAVESRVEATPRIEERGNVFRMGQAKDVESFLTNVFNRSTAAAGDIDTASSAAISAFTNYGKALSRKLSSSAKVDFKDAKAAGGTVDTSPVLAVIDEKLASLPPEVAALDTLRNALLRVKDEYLIPGTPASVTPSTILGPTGQPASITTTPAVPASIRAIDIDRLQKNLSAWGEAAYSGKADFGKGNIFEGVAPGQVKGIAISVLGGFRKSLDEAINNGVPGADKLLKARDNFKNNLAQIEDFSNKPLTKYFDVPTASALTPEGVIDKLSKAKPSERIFLADVLQNHPQGNLVLDTVRRTQLESIIDKAKKAAGGAAEGKPTIDLNVLLKELNNKKGDFNYLIPIASGERANVNLSLEWLKKVAKGATEGETALKGDAYALTRGAGGTAQAGLIAGELVSLARLVLEDPKLLANVVFDPETTKKLVAAKNKGSIQKTLDVLKDVGITTAQQAVRAGPRFSANEPTIQNEVTDAQSQEELNFLLEEQKRRNQGQSIMQQSGLVQ